MAFPRMLPLVIPALLALTGATNSRAQPVASQPAASQLDWPAELDGGDQLSAADREAIARVADRTEGLDDLAFYILLDHARDLKPSAATRATLDDLLRSPESLRGRSVRVELRCVSTEPFMPVRPKPFARLHETIAYAPNGQTVKLVSHFTPAEFAPGQRFEVIGLFYKLQTCDARDDGRVKLLVPVIVADRIAPLETRTSGFDARVAVILGAVVVALLVWCISQRRRRGPADRTIDYRITPCAAPPNAHREGPT